MTRFEDETAESPTNFIFILEICSMEISKRNPGHLRENLDVQKRVYPLVRLSYKEHMDLITIFSNKPEISK